MRIFPRRCEGADTLKYIFPSMQKEVQKVIDVIKSIDCIQRIIIFGSAVTLNCGMRSDLDIAVDAPGITDEDEFLRIIRPIKRAVDVETDIIHYNSIQSELLLNEINTKGVDVYDNRVC
ncbi:nucleotidyltransferase domain-containing protein [Porcipelethomonas ammoniilytica]|uniref:nucleotidyltransferase family protein n=1 Tax=Porcipelethomonas ammoniilytica TaxID=2981722 RepID=UPI000822FA88|nr:nucleotidyltransferase domain-containing protein [Porcipelethomonas ammoniilytica]MCU6720732.1 nucleotidyltransferase domain-containing protein [Porcipelethomonas ammoniilytica]SCJ23229.1 Uncharacterised protein [uncultured Ruminococcus sp.]